MITTGYTITIPILNSGTTSNSYAVPNITGSANIIFTLAGSDSTISKLRKMVFEFSNDSGKQYTLQTELTGGLTLSGAQISHNFLSTTLSATTYTVSMTSIRLDLTYDYYEIDVTILQPSFANYLGMSTVRTVLFDTPETTDNLLITAETNSPHQLVNFILPGNPIV